MKKLTRDETEHGQHYYLASEVDAALARSPAAQPDYRAVKTYYEGKPVYVSQPAQKPNKISTEELIYMTGVYDGKVLEREACAKVLESISNAPDMQSYAAAIRARGNT